MACVVKFLKHRICLRISKKNYGFLGRFCKKEPESSDGDDCCKTIQLEKSFKLYNLKEEPESTVTLTRKEAIKLYEKMQTIREIERACSSLYKQKLIMGFCHLYLGQEAVAVGLHSCMRRQDSIAGGYRTHAWAWLMGVSSHALIAEVCQRQTGICRGRSGSMHTFARNYYGGQGIVGAQIPLGTGVAFAHSYRCDGGVNFALYGDGSSNQGQVFEVFNMAFLWKLPIVYVCENNGYGMGTQANRSSANTDYYTRGDYIPGLWVNGMDVLSVRSATAYAIQYAMNYGPIIVEFNTYRYEGHSMSDPGTSYRSREEIQEVRNTNDPIMNFRKLCINEGLLTEDEFKKMSDRIKAEIKDTVEQVKKDPMPELSDMSSDVYLKNLEDPIRGICKRNIRHSNVGTLYIPLGRPKPTPKSEMKEVPKKVTAKKAGDAKQPAPPPAPPPPPAPKK